MVIGDINPIVPSSAIRALLMLTTYVAAMLTATIYLCINLQNISYKTVLQLHIDLKAAYSSLNLSIVVNIL